VAGAVEAISWLVGGGGITALGIAWSQARTGRTQALGERRLAAAADFSTALKRGRIGYELAREEVATGSIEKARTAIEKARETALQCAEPLTLVEFLFGPDSDTAEAAVLAYNAGIGGLEIVLRRFLARREDEGREPMQSLAEQLDEEWSSAFSMMRDLHDQFNRAARAKIWAGLRHGRRGRTAR
jgi:hypothetical protein